ncbi:MAG: hypothetical protein FJ297_09135 [Planctomycetes bacterium]|nr:hypothetical protein [Planctomycetota bacterium]
MDSVRVAKTGTAFSRLRPRIGALAIGVLAIAALPIGGGQTSPPIDKAFIAFRIGTPQWMPEDRYEELLALFERHKGVTDEITFFTSFTHPAIPAAEMRRRCGILASRIARAKELGYRAGINVLSTMGHHEENLDHSLQGPFTPVTDIDGNVSRGSFCPNDPALHDYVRGIYTDVAEANPDYIWVDDDVRLMGHMPIGLTCFCDHCLASFSAVSKTTHTRASLRAALTTGEPESQAAVRNAWLDHNRRTIGGLLERIERTVHAAKPGMPIGFMTGDRFFEGYDFDHWAERLAGPDQAPVYWRPGGGFYEDATPAGMVGKSHDIGRQVSLLPPWVRTIESEIENFPYQRLKKSAHITAVEAASHLGAGCTGAAFNVLSGNNEPLDEFEPLVQKLHAMRPFYDRMARHLGRARPVGLFTAWNKDQAAAGDIVGNPGWATSHLGQSYQTFEMGLPAAYSSDTASVTLLFPQSVAAMSRDAIRHALSGAVYADVETLNRLNQMGYHELTGLSADRPRAVDCIEEFTSHALNGPFAGRQRDCRQSFYRVNGYVGYTLTSRDGKAQTLSRLVDYAGNEVSPCAMAVYENALGGRVCVSGYYPWDHLHSLSKNSQMKSVMRWLSRDRLPAYVASYHKTNIWVREPRDGQVAVALLNATFDRAEQVELAVLARGVEATVFDMEAGEHRIGAASDDGPYRRFVLPPIEPWSMRLVVIPDQ